MEKIIISNKDKETTSSIIDTKTKDGSVLAEVHVNLDGSRELTFYNDSIKNPITFDDWVDSCPDNKIKLWIKEGREFFK